MEPTQQTGSFGAAIAPGAGDPIKAAMARRGLDVGTTQQSSITPNPVPSPISSGASSAVPQTGSMGTNTAIGPVGGLPPQTKESELIIRALTDRLKTFSKIEEAQGIPPEPQVTGGI